MIHATRNQTKCSQNKALIGLIREESNRNVYHGKAHANVSVTANAKATDVSELRTMAEYALQAFTAQTPAAWASKDTVEHVETIDVACITRPTAVIQSITYDNVLRDVIAVHVAKQLNTFWVTLADGRRVSQHDYQFHKAKVRVMTGRIFIDASRKAFSTDDEVTSFVDLVIVDLSNRNINWF